MGRSYRQASRASRKGGGDLRGTLGYVVHAQEGPGEGIGPPALFMIPNFLPLLPGRFVPDHVTMAWLVMLVLGTLAYMTQRGLREVPGPLQNLMEVTIEIFHGLIDGVIGHHGRRYLPLIGALGLFILFSNLLGLIPGMKSPTANINTTAGLAVGDLFCLSHHRGPRGRRPDLFQALLGTGRRATKAVADHHGSDHDPGLLFRGGDWTPLQTGFSHHSSVRDHLWRGCGDSLFVLSGAADCPSSDDGPCHLYQRSPDIGLGHALDDLYRRGSGGGPSRRALRESTRPRTEQFGGERDPAQVN